jgi:hypothetical protein
VNNAELAGLKKRIHEFCLSLLQERIAEAETAIKRAEDASLQEEKSSAGDKYETGRAMGHLDQERYKRVRHEARLALQFTKQLDPQIRHETARPGALALTGEGIFYLGPGIGERRLDEFRLFLISAASPAGKVLMGKKSGDTFLFAGKELPIIHVL